jgi:PAS domain-containing protein
LGNSGKEVGAEGWTIARAVTHGETSTPEVVNIEALDREQRTILMHPSALSAHDNQIIGAIEFNQDITEMNKTEKSLQRSHNQWDAILRQSLFGMVYFSHETRVLE